MYWLLLPQQETFYKLQCVWASRDANCGQSPGNGPIKHALSHYSCKYQDLFRFMSCVWVCDHKIYRRSQSKWFLSVFGSENVWLAFFAYECDDRCLRFPRSEYRDLNKYAQNRRIAYVHAFDSGTHIAQTKIRMHTVSVWKKKSHVFRSCLMGAARRELNDTFI